MELSDYIGRSYGFLSIIDRSPDRGNGKKPVVKFICRCKCGQIVHVKKEALLSGHSKSCGCRKRKHGDSKTRLYEIWKNMRRRCYDPNNKRYSNYGGRGITICSEWSEYLNFKNWALNNGYTDELTIDRIDVNKNYSPDNCRWADAKTQANNTSRNKYIDFNGQRLTMSQIADATGLSYSTIQHRVERHQNLGGVCNAIKRLPTESNTSDP